MELHFRLNWESDQEKWTKIEKELIQKLFKNSSSKRIRNQLGYLETTKSSKYVSKLPNRFRMGIYRKEAG